MRIKFVLRICIYCLFFLLALVLLGIWLLPRYFPAEQIQAKILLRLSEFLNRPVQAENFEWTFFPRVSLLSRNFHVLDKENKTMLEVPQVWLAVDPRSFKEKELRINKIIFTEPLVHLILQQDGGLNVQTLFKEVKEKINALVLGRRKKIFFEKFVFQNARLTFQDETRDIRLNDTGIVFNGEASVQQEEPRFLFKLVGHSSKEKNLFLTTEGEFGKESWIRSEVKQLPLETLVPYFAQLKSFQGKAEARFHYSKKQGEEPKRTLQGRIAPLTLEKKGSQLNAKVAWKLSLSTPYALMVEAESLHNSAQLRVRFSTSASEPINFEFGARKFHLQELLTWAKELQPEKKKKARRIAYGVVQIDSGTIYKFNFSDFRSASITISPAGWEFKNFRGRALDGSIRGTLKIKTGKKPQIEFSGSGRTLQAEQLLGLWQSTPSISGKLNLKGKLSGPSSKNFLKEANGQIRLEMGEGTLTNLPIFLKVLSAVNLRTVFEKRMGEKELKRFAFQSLQGDLKFKHGNLSTKKLKLDSKTLSLNMAGSVDLKKQTIDAKVSVRALTFIDEVLKHIPLLNIIYAEKKSIVPLWAGLKGNLKEPEVIAFQLTKPKLEP